VENHYGNGMKQCYFIMAALALMLLVGCRATQPVVWKYSAPMDNQREGVVSVVAKCEMPAENVEILRESIQEKVDEVLVNSMRADQGYRIEVAITRYDRGMTPARILSLGIFGRIYLEGEVTVRQGMSPDIIGFGTFQKWFGPMLPLSSMFASMEWTVMPKVGKAVAKAIKKSTEK
jgi:hypothetical protein